MTSALSTSESLASAPASNTAALVPVLPSKMPFATAVTVHISTSTTKFTITLKFVSRSMRERFDGVSPPLSMIFVSAPVNATRPTTHAVLRSEHPRRSISLIVTGSVLAAPVAAST